MGRFHHPNVHKSRGSSEIKLKITPQIFCYGYSPCTKHSSSSPLHITFVTQTKQRYLDSLLCKIGEQTLSTGKETICQDRRVFFKTEHAFNSCKIMSQVLGFLNVKEYLHKKIVDQVLSFGRMPKNKRKVSRGLFVELTFVETFLGDRVSCLEAMEKAWEDRQAQLSEEGIDYFDVTLV